MWRKCKCATEWDGFWICDKCDNAFYWKILGWQKDNVKDFIVIDVSKRLRKMTYKELLSEKEDILKEKELIEKRLSDIDNKISMAKQDQAENIFNEILSKIVELNKIGYNVVSIMDDDLENIGHEYGLSWKKIILTEKSF